MRKKQDGDRGAGLASLVLFLLREECERERRKREMTKGGKEERSHYNKTYFL